jgi:hypothetical protein
MKTMNRANAGLISLILGVVLLLITLTYPSFFFFNPFEAGISIHTLLQALSLLGWITLISVPVFILNKRVHFDGMVQLIFLVSVLIWPAGILLIRVMLMINTSDPHLLYLFEHPVFIVSDVIVPAIYVMMWAQFRKPATAPAPADEKSVTVH